MKNSVLVTGSSGYIGSHLSKFFTKAGWPVVGYDRVLPPEGLEKYLSANIVADIEEEGEVRKACRENKVDLVVHCAAKCLVGESVEMPDLYRLYNVTKAKKMMAAIVKTDVSGVLFSSSAAVYGAPSVVPIPEDHKKAPVNPYGETKLEFEGHLHEISQDGAVQYAALRYFNAAGADSEGELGENHDPETHLIPNAIRASLGVISAVEIYGNDYDTKDGSCVRDYIHVEDLATAHFLAAKLLRESHQGGIYNLGTGDGYSVLEILDEVDRQSGKAMKRMQKPRRPGDPPVLVADPAKANAELNWMAEFSDLSEIVETALRWFQKAL